MSFLLWLVFGGLVGWIASLITKDNAKMGFVANIVVGLVGSLIGGWIATLLNLGTFRVFNFGGLLISILGAVILLTLINLIRGKMA